MNVNTRTSSVELGGGGEPRITIASAGAKGFSKLSENASGGMAAEPDEEVLPVDPLDCRLVPSR